MCDDLHFQILKLFTCQSQLEILLSDEARG
jgi:hypothetical protein